MIPKKKKGLTNSPVAQKRNSILKHSNSISKQDKGSKKVSIEHVNEKSKSKVLGELIKHSKNKKKH